LRKTFAARDLASRYNKQCAIDSEKQQMPEFPPDSRENGFSDWIKANSWSGSERLREAWKHYANAAGSFFNVIDSACHGLPASGSGLHLTEVATATTGDEGNL
jgi:hypothetical protein